jgi:hypothetical protein
MQDFVQQQMTNILQPFAQRVEQLHRETEQIAQRSVELDGRVTTGEAKLEINAEKLHQLCGEGIGGVDRMRADLEAAQKEFRGANFDRKFQLLEATGNAMRESHDKTEIRVEKVVSELAEFRRLLEEKDANVHKVELKIWQTANLAERLETGLG